jgi:aminoglycoside 3-N-acetyltransferase
MYSRDQLADDFRALGVAAGDAIMLHASVRAVGEVAGGPDQIHLALRQALTENGTLVMYASCPQYCDEVGRGELTLEQEKEILDKLPAFDPLTARAQRENGALVEFFRTYPGARVNHHVARFVLWGKQAEHQMSEQPWHYAIWSGSILHRFLEREGKILLLGCDHDAVTFLHYAEHVAKIPGKRVARFRVPVEEDGKRVWREMEEVDTSGRGGHAHWPERFFAKLVDGLLMKTDNRGAFVGNARSYLFRARDLLDFALPWMSAIAADAEAGGELAELGSDFR